MTIFHKRLFHIYYYTGGVEGRGQRRRRVEPASPSQLWNGELHTNNHVEGFHNALKASVTKEYPHF